MAQLLLNPVSDPIPTLSDEPSSLLYLPISSFGFSYDELVNSIMGDDDFNGSNVLFTSKYYQKTIFIKKNLCSRKDVRLRHALYQLRLQ